MSATVTQVKESLSAMLHGGTLNRVRNIEAMFKRATDTMLSKIDPVETIRVAPLVNMVHDDIYNYSLPSDYGKLIDLFPQDNRQFTDVSVRRPALDFDLKRALQQKTISIEGSEGSKIIRINWRSRQGKVLNSMNSLNGNGAWSAVATASGIELDTITKISGGGAIRFDLAASGDGIENTTMSQVDMTDEDEVGEIFIWFYFPSIANLTSVSIRWGNDLTTNYWTSTAQTTQADGTAFKVGWNLLKFSWSAATETGTVNPATIDSFRLTIATTGAIANMRVDNIIFSRGRNFDIKYHSKYITKNSVGTWIPRTTSDDDIVVLDDDCIQIYLLECLIAAAQQVEGTDSGFDVSWAKNELGAPGKGGLYGSYAAEHPSGTVKTRSSYGSSPSRGRW